MLASYLRAGSKSHSNIFSSVPRYFLSTMQRGDFVSSKKGLSVSTALKCFSCNFKAQGYPSPIFKCPKAAENAKSDHVLMPDSLAMEDLKSLVSSAKVRLHGASRDCCVK